MASTHSPPPGSEASKPIEITDDIGSHDSTTRAPTSNVPFNKPPATENPVLDATAREIEATTDFVQRLHYGDPSLQGSITSGMAEEAISGFVATLQADGHGAKVQERPEVNDSQGDDVGKRKRGASGEELDEGERGTKRVRVEGAGRDQELSTPHAEHNAETRPQDETSAVFEDISSPGRVDTLGGDAVGTSYFEEAFSPE